MATLTIKDLPLCEELDRNGMADVRGGHAAESLAPLFNLPVEGGVASSSSVNNVLKGFADALQTASRGG